MKDNVLTLVDMRTFGVQDPMTPEGALMLGSDPLLPPCMTKVDRLVETKRLCRLAREYLVDFDLVRASARAGIPWELVRTAERHPIFITLIQQMCEELKPEEIASRREVLMMLKREACTAAKSRDRIAAIKTLAHVAGFTQGEDGPGGGKGGAPTINITFNGVAKPEIDITPAQERLL